MYSTTEEYKILIALFKYVYNAESLKQLATLELQSKPDQNALLGIDIYNHNILIYLKSMS